MDVLSSGSDRPSWRPLAAVRGWRPSGAVVVAQAVALALVAAAAVLSLGPVGERAELAGLKVRVLASTVAVRGGSTEGVLRVAVGSTGPRPVVVTAAALDLPGVVLQPLRRRLPLALEPGDVVELDVAFRVPACAELAPRGTVTLGITVQDRPPAVLALPVQERPSDGEIDVAAFAAGCRPTSTPYVVALAVEQVSGQAQTAGARARGDLAIELRNAGAPASLVAVTGEVPGVLFVSRTAPAGTGEAAAGGRVTVPLPFVVPFCPELGSDGRLLVTVRDAAGGLRVLAFPTSGVAGVDLTLVFGACRAAG